MFQTSWLSVCVTHQPFEYNDPTSHIERTVNVLGEGPTKITITNTSIDKQITLKRDYIHKFENRGFRRFITYAILF